MILRYHDHVTFMNMNSDSAVDKFVNKYVHDCVYIPVERTERSFVCDRSTCSIRCRSVTYADDSCGCVLYRVTTDECVKCNEINDEIIKKKCEVDVICNEMRNDIRELHSYDRDYYNTKLYYLSQCMRRLSYIRSEGACNRIQEQERCEGAWKRIQEQERCEDDIATYRRERELAYERSVRKSKHATDYDK